MQVLDLIKINIVILLLSGSVFAQSTDLNSLKNCEEAVSLAVTDVERDSLCWYKPIYADAHDKYYVEDPALYYKRRRELDSLMFSFHKIRVKRYDYLNDTLLNRNQIAHCYNSSIVKHMDSTYASYFMIEIYNELARLNGEPPIDSTWVRKKKIVNQE